MAMSKKPEGDFVPAAPQLWTYDVLSFLLTRARHWRPALLQQVAPAPGDVIADVGCGTGTQLRLVARACPSVSLIGIDPDEAIRRRARTKLAGVAASVELLAGYLRDASALLSGRGVTKVQSSLVFHQVPLEEKRAGLAAIYAALPSGGGLHVADYGLQRTPKMRSRFRMVQKGDGYDNTEPNAQGVLPHLMTDVGFQEVEETRVFETVSGSISLYRAVRR